MISDRTSVPSPAEPGCLAVNLSAGLVTVALATFLIWLLQEHPPLAILVLFATVPSALAMLTTKSEYLRTRKQQLIAFVWCSCWNTITILACVLAGMFSSWDASNDEVHAAMGFGAIAGVVLSQFLSRELLTGKRLPPPPRDL